MSQTVAWTKGPWTFHQPSCAGLEVAQPAPMQRTLTGSTHRFLTGIATAAAVVFAPLACVERPTRESTTHDSLSVPPPPPDPTDECVWSELGTYDESKDG